MFRGLPDSVRGKPYSAGDRVGFKLNFKKKTITFYKNGEPQGRQGTGITGDIVPAGKRSLMLIEYNIIIGIIIVG